jgi:NADH:ubiquinone oxidoreductase subunit H
MIGAWLLLILSISGVIFLSSIANMLSSNSPYIYIGGTQEKKKMELAYGVRGAIVMYVLTGLAAAIFIYRSNRTTPYYKG